MILIVIFFVLLLFKTVKTLQLGLIGCGVGSLISSLIVKHRMDDIDVTILEKNERVGKHYYY